VRDRGFSGGAFPKEIRIDNLRLCQVAVKDPLVPAEIIDGYLRIETHLGFKGLHGRPIGINFKY
jgi:hypothetical protein